jgi:hypothetical protein
VGPGAVLAGLLRNINPDLECYKVGEAGDFENLPPL